MKENCTLEWMSAFHWAESGSETESNFVIVRHGSTSKNPKTCEKWNADEERTQCWNAKFIELNWFELNIHSERHALAHSLIEPTRMNLDLYDFCPLRKKWKKNTKTENRSDGAYMQNTTCTYTGTSGWGHRTGHTEMHSIKSFHLLQKWIVQCSPTTRSLCLVQSLHLLLFLSPAPVKMRAEKLGKKGPKK